MIWRRLKILSNRTIADLDYIIPNTSIISPEKNCYTSWNQVIIDAMRILSRSTLRNFWKNYPDAEEALKTWYYEASRADWQSPVDVKTAHRSASIIANNRVVFNIKGNSYRLIVAIRYDIGIIFVRFIGTHSEYNKVDAETV